MSVPNFSSLAGLEVAEKLGGVVGGGGGVGSRWLLCLTSTLVTFCCFELSCWGFRNVPNLNYLTKSKFIRKQIVPFLLNRRENMNIRIWLLIN